MNRFKKTVSLLVIFLLCTLSLIGCQSKKTMFDVMKEAQEITSAKVNMNLTMEVPNSEDFKKIGVTISGTGSEKAAAFDLDVTVDELSYSLKDFIRMVDNQMYLNFASIFKISGMSASDLGMKNWISVPNTGLNDESIKSSKTLSSSVLAGFEVACKDQKITQDGDTYTLTIPKDKLVSFAQAVLDVVNSNIDSWYDQYVDVLEKSDVDSLFKISGEENPLSDLKKNKKENLETWKKMYDELSKELKEGKIDSDIDSAITYSIKMTGKEGSRVVNQSIEANVKDANESAKIKFTSKSEETTDIKVEAPNKDDVMSIEELNNLFNEDY